MINILLSNPFMVEIGRFFSLFISLGVVIFLAIVVTRFVAKQRFSFGKNIKIIDSIGVGRQNSICIVNIGTKYFLIGITKENIVFLQNIDEEDIELKNVENNNLPFSKYLEKYIIKKDKKNDDL
ncbi:MAG: flagellar biosynthetic protein FliO [Defluviitaleaceae bacterium]|nr:flagellar biosynthetic protein FliO [Defluviitaleaceae bacterium]